MTIACFIRYEIDPFQRDNFAAYADAWARIIPRCGGHLIGFEACGLIAFATLADYEAYRTRLRSDAEARANFEFARRERFIVREQRSFTEVVASAFNQPALADEAATLTSRAAPRGPERSPSWTWGRVGTFGRPGGTDVTGEPRLARIAALVADPSRARMLSFLLGGECASAGELARAAGVGASTASGHLGQLVEAGLVACEPRGRHRYFQLADADDAHALEALALAAGAGWLVRCPAGTAHGCWAR